MITVASGSDNTITVAKLTSASTAGVGVFDVLMRSVKAQLDAEYQANRIKGSEYATVYLGALQAVLQTAFQYVLQETKVNQDILMMDKQILLLQSQIEMTNQQKANAIIEGTVLTNNAAKITAETAHLTQQTSNAVIEGENLTKQGLMVDAQKAQVTQQTTNLVAEALNIPKQGAQLDADTAQATAQTALVTQQRLNVIDELLTATAQRAKIAADAAHIAGQTAMVAQQTNNLISEELAIDAKTAHTTQQTTNLVAEALNIPKQGLMLDTEVLLKNQQLTRTNKEIEVLEQKRLTELAQVESTGVDADSIIGRQKALYEAQTLGFGQEAKHKAAQLMISTYNIRRTTAEAEEVNAENKLMDEFIGAAVGEMFESAGITEPVIP